MLRFTFGERKICSTTKKPQNIMNMIVVLSLPPKMTLFSMPSKKPLKNRKLNFSCSALFHMKTRVCFKYFVHDCIGKRTF